MIETIISPINAFSDNYIWAITAKSPNIKEVALVDPGDAIACINYIEKNNLVLSTILITHHHADHVGGIEALLSYCKKNNWALNVYGPANENIPFCNIKLTEKDTVIIPALNISFNIIDLPGHTLGHIAYVNEQSLFCGDTLFSGGCGRIFEGTPQQMYSSLNKLNRLAEHIHVYCAHEYTLANLRFALTVEPDNNHLKNYYNDVLKLRENNKPSIPTSIGLEKKINPFLRCSTPSIQSSAQKFGNKKATNDLETFSLIRRWKDQF